MVKVAFAIGLLFLSSPPRQNLPLAAVPDTLPAESRAKLQEERAGISGRIKVHNAKVSDFLERCGPARIPPGPNQQAQLQACVAEQESLKDSDARLQKEKAEFAKRVAAAVRCGPIEERLAHDQEQMRIFNRMIEMHRSEIRDWNRLNDEARKDLLLGGGKLLFSATAKSMAAKEGSARALKGKLTEIENRLVKQRRRQAVNTALWDKYDAALRKYAAARVTAETGKAANLLYSRASMVEALWMDFRTKAGLVAAAEAEADAAIREVMKDPLFQHAVKEEATFGDYVKSQMSVLTKASDLAVFAGSLSSVYSVTSYIVDLLLVNIPKLVLAGFQGHVQSDAISEEVLQMKSLQERIKQGVDRLKACKAE